MYDEIKNEKRQREDQEILQMMEMLSQLPETPVPDQFDLRLRRALKQETAKKKAAVWKKWTAVAACLLIGLLSVHMIRSGVGADQMNNMAQSDESAIESTAPCSEDGIDAQYATGVTAEEGSDDGEPSAKEDLMAKNSAAQGGGEGDSGVSQSDAELESVPEEAMEGFSMRSAKIVDGDADLTTSADNSTDSGISRGALASETQRAFETDCEQALSWIAQSVADDDSQKLAAAMNYKNDLNYSQESAEKALKLYDDLFSGDGGELTYGRVNLTAWSNSNIYRLSDGARDLLVVVSNTPEGMKVSEPVIDKSQWLYDQIGDRDFTLVDVICQPDGKEIEFLVDMDDEIRSFVWKEKES